MNTYKVYYTFTSTVLKSIGLGTLSANALFCAENEGKAREMATERLKRVRTPGGAYNELVSIDKVEEYNGPSVADLLTEEEIEKLERGEMEEGIINDRGVQYRKEK